MLNFSVVRGTLLNRLPKPETRKLSCKICQPNRVRF